MHYLYSPYGEPIAATGTNQTSFGFTGEPTDGNGLVYLRARYYAPNLGVFTELDPLEEMEHAPGNLNRYSWVQGNVVNRVDASGLCSMFDNTRASTIRESNYCHQAKNTLREQYQISLTTDPTTNLQASKNWTVTRVLRIFDAVMRIESVLGSGLARKAMNNLEFQLRLDDPYDGEAALTQNCSLIYLDIGEESDTGYQHTVANLIHEIGHIVTLSQPTGRIPNSEKFGASSEMKNRPVALWDQINTARTISRDAGWNADRRESKVASDAEEVPDMFMFYILAKSGDSRYGFDTEVASVGEVRRIFLEGGSIPKSPNVGPGMLTRSDGSIIESAGLRSWLQISSCPQSTSNTSSSMRSTLNWVIMMNGGFCNNQLYEV